jgi:uncharacterized protein YdeI (YjbR/CyaY-like superfamily)
MTKSAQKATDCAAAKHREEVFFASRQELRGWLSEHVHQANGIWAIFYKKSMGVSDLSWDAIVEECLCFGWIDSLPGKVDASKTKIYSSPRKKDSGWSQRNKTLLVAVEQRGLMTEFGRKAVAGAIANGSWTRFDLAEQLVLSEELREILTADRTFATNWNRLTDARKRQYLQQIYDAKKELTAVHASIKYAKQFKTRSGYLPRFLTNDF